MAFVLNPYDLDLDLNNKDDRKIFTDGSKGLKNEEDFFDGDKSKFSNWSKLMEPLFKKTRLMGCLGIPTEWDATPGNTAAARAARRVPTVEGIVNIFDSHRIERNRVEHYCDLVWSNSNFGNDTPQYFTRFSTAPTNQADLDNYRQQRRLRHVMMGQMIWSSLTSKFQLKITIKKDQFLQQDEFEGPLL